MQFYHIEEKRTVRSNNAVMVFCFSAFGSLDPAKSKIALPSGCQLLHPRDSIQTSGNAGMCIHIEASEAHLWKQQQPHFHRLCEIADGNRCFFVFFVLFGKNFCLCECNSHRKNLRIFFHYTIRFHILQASCKNFFCKSSEK